jgi:hypothetical protein
MNEEKLNQILNKIGQAEVPPDIAMIAEKSSQNFSAILKIPQPKQSVFSPLKLIAAAAVVVVAFSAGWWSKPAASPDVVTNSPRITASATINQNPEGFWQQKLVAAMQPRPYAQTQFDQIRHLNTYKQYLTDKTFNKGE